MVPACILPSYQSERHGAQYSWFLDFNQSYLHPIPYVDPFIFTLFPTIQISNIMTFLQQMRNQEEDDNKHI